MIAPGGGSIEKGRRAVVVGGGIAGVAAATVLAERGVEVTLIERQQYLGGRAGAWTETLSTGESFEMERGFHAFFRQYYNLQSLLRRIDPELRFLARLEDYPILGPEGLMQSFSGLPRQTPLNVITLTARTPTLSLRDLTKVNALRALEMLTYDATKTYTRRDQMSAKQYLDSLRFPSDARRLLFDVFSHSFFNPESEMSAGELLMMFHFYFTGNPEGLVFDVARAPFSKCIWEPFERYLGGLGAKIRKGEAVGMIERGADDRWLVVSDRASYPAESVVIAVTVPALQELVHSSPKLRHPEWCAAIEGLALTKPFAVWRLWLDRPLAAGRAPFAGTTGVGELDNISLYHLFEDESRAWAERTGGSVVELHAYAVGESWEEDCLRQDLLGALHRFYPESRDARILEERFLMSRDCPAFAPGSHARRPGVATPFDGLTLAGDFVKLEIPSALMERAAASGFLAANRVLEPMAAEPETIASVRDRGLLSVLPI